MPKQKRLDSYALFPADRKQKDTSPDYTGRLSLSRDTVEWLMNQINSGGDAELYLSGWKNETRDGKRYLGGTTAPSKRVQNEDNSYRQAPPTRVRTVVQDDLDDDIPF